MNISAAELNSQICEHYNLKKFDCLGALFGWNYKPSTTYVITVTEEKLQGLRDFESEYFELYVTHCRMIYEYLLEKGCSDVVYITQ